MLKRTRRVSSWAERSMLCTPAKVLCTWIIENGHNYRRTFKIECDNQSFFSRSHRHPNTFGSSHRRSSERCIDKVIEGETFSNGLLSHRGYHSDRLRGGTLTYEAVVHTGGSHLVCHVRLEYGLVPPKRYRIDNTIDLGTKQRLFDFRRVYAIF